MPRFEPKTYTTILDRLVNRTVARTPLSNLEAGGVVHTVLSGVAREIDDLNFQMTNLQDVWDIDTATGVDLDERALDYNPDQLVRQTATEAIGAVVFSRSGTSGLVSIPIGTVVRVPNGGPEFATTAAGSIPDLSSSSGSIAIAALVPGAAGNVASGTITQLDAVAGVETVTNASATTGGQDLESDEDFRGRIRLYLRSLARGTVDALKFAVLGVSLPSLGSVRFADVVELQGADLGIVEIYVDNGAGTIESTATVTTQTVIASAGGGEQRFFLTNVPVVQGQPVAVLRNGGLLVENTDYVLNYATGQVTLSSTVFPSGLTAADAITATYTYYTGLIAEAQKVVDGDPSDRTNYPGYRAAGTQVFVLAPTVLQQTVIGSLVITSEFVGETADIQLAVQQAINRYINGLGIAEDVILSELIAAAQAVKGVFDVLFTTPTANVAIGSGELARVQDANIDVT